MLTVNVDDVGIHPAINRAVSRLIREHAVDGFSVVACGRSVKEILSSSASVSSDLDVGCHLTLVEEKPLRVGGSIQSLIDAKTGCFYKNYRSFLWRVSTGSIRKDEIVSELSAQIESLLEAGIKISHLDSHQHVHIHPFLLGVVIELAHKFRIPTIRIPIDPPRVLYRYFGVRAMAAFGLNWLSKKAFQRVCEAGLQPRLSIGVVRSGRMDSNLITHYMRAIRNASESYELIMHPNDNDEEFNQCYKHWHFQGEKEFAALLSPDLGPVVEQGGFQYGRIRDNRHQTLQSI